MCAKNQTVEEKDMSQPKFKTETREEAIYRCVECDTEINEWAIEWHLRHYHQVVRITTKVTRRVD